LSPGDHPRVQHDSFLDYRKTIRFACEELEDRIATGRMKQQEPASDALRERILVGAKESERIAKKHLYVLYAQGLLG